MKNLTILEEQLLDEYYRCERNLKLNIQELENLNIEGYLSEKRISGKKYYYIQWKENKKLKSKYVKDISEEEIEKYNLKAVYKRNIRALKHDLRIIKRALGGKLIEKYRSEF